MLFHAMLLVLSMVSILLFFSYFIKLDEVVDGTFEPWSGGRVKYG